MTTSHPYRDQNSKMSPMWFDTDGNQPFYVDIRTIQNMWMEPDGSWKFNCPTQQSSFLLGAEAGAKLFNALRAYSESHHEQGV